MGLLKGTVKVEEEEVQWFSFSQGGRKRKSRRKRLLWRVDKVD